ncbi:MAG: nuclear transport factor 2 family protein [Rubrivivax sp.]|jgi:ketosteroid isomerase-like protein|nr:nuclear transport factor 2 family protein [Rubrivivax sp.]
MDPVTRVKRYFETLTPESVARIGEVYAEDAWFKDPFNEVRGTSAIARIFARMFAQLDAPRFVVRDTVASGAQAFLTWDFRFRLKRRRLDEQTIRGATHLRFAPDGRIIYHRDYWDVAEELYEKLPALGPLLRLLKRRVTH